MSLIDLINQYAPDEAASGKWDAVVAILTAQTVERRSTGLTKFKPFIELFGLDTAEQVLQGWSTSEVGKSLRNQLEVNGLDFADQYTIDLIDKLDAQSKWQTGIAKKLKELGVRTVSPAESGGIADPTTKECEDVWNQWIDETQVQADAAKRAVMVQAIQKLDAETIIGEVGQPTLDDTLNEIRKSLEAFGAWA